jgi:hypothetical protein
VGAHPKSDPLQPIFRPVCLRLTSCHSAPAEPLTVEIWQVWLPGDTVQFLEAPCDLVVKPGCPCRLVKSNKVCGGHTSDALGRSQEFRLGIPGKPWLPLSRLKICWLAAYFRQALLYSRCLGYSFLMYQRSFTFSL